MCEVWKWIIIGDLCILVPIRLFGTFPLVDSEAYHRLRERITPYMRFWWLGVFVLIFASVVYAAHCRG